MILISGSGARGLRGRGLVRIISNHEKERGSGAERGRRRGRRRGREGEGGGSKERGRPIKVENIDKKQGMSDNNSLYNLLNPEM